MVPWQLREGSECRLLGFRVYRAWGLCRVYGLSGLGFRVYRALGLVFLASWLIQVVFFRILANSRNVSIPNLAQKLPKHRTEFKGKIGAEPALSWWLLISMMV